MPKATFLGHSCFVISNNQTAIIIDPFLSGNPVAKVAPKDIKVDYVFLTHAHGDHIGDAVEIAKANDATIISVFEIANYCESQGCKVHPMHIGGGHQFPFGKIKLTIAHHGSALPDGSYGGNPCGVLLTMDDRTLYHPGDTGLFLDMKLIGEMNVIDLAVLPIGDNFTMDIDDAVKATEFLKARHVVPMHYNTFDVIAADPDAFVGKVKKLGTEATVLQPGESLEY
jgi:L-ascorbate metabolism protein UlaG (beta-lactamase superfamily)